MPGRVDLRSENVTRLNESVELVGDPGSKHRSVHVGEEAALAQVTAGGSWSLDQNGHVPENVRDRLRLDRRDFVGLDEVGIGDGRFPPRESYCLEEG